MRDRLLKELVECSPAEKAELFQVLVRELCVTSDSPVPVLVRTQNGADLGYFVPVGNDGMIDIDLMLSISLLAEPKTLVPIEDVLAESHRPSA